MYGETHEKIVLLCIKQAIITTCIRLPCYSPACVGTYLTIYVFTHLPFYSLIHIYICFMQRLTASRRQTSTGRYFCHSMTPRWLPSLATNALKTALPLTRWMPFVLQTAAGRTRTVPVTIGVKVGSEMVNQSDLP